MEQNQQGSVAKHDVGRHPVPGQHLREEWPRRTAEVSLTFGTQGGHFTQLGDALLPSHTADIDLSLRGQAIEHPVTLGVEEVLRWSQTVRQLAIQESVRGEAVTPTGERHAIPLEDFSWRHGESGR